MILANDIYTLAGWVQMIGFSLCGLPLAISAFKNKVSYEDRNFLFLWTLSEIALLLHVHGSLFISVQAVVNLLCLSVIWWYRRDTPELNPIFKDTILKIEKNMKGKPPL